MPEQTLHEAVIELRSAISALHELIEREYPRRGELEEEFAKKITSERRWILVVVLLPFIFMISYFSSITTISTCFLGEIGKDPGPAICNVIPGYSDSLSRNEQLVGRFERLIAITERNDERLRRLEEQVG